MKKLVIAVMAIAVMITSVIKSDASIYYWRDGAGQVQYYGMIDDGDPYTQHIYGSYNACVIAFNRAKYPY